MGIYIMVCEGSEDVKGVPNIWIGQTESAKFLLAILSDINRGK